MTLLPPQQIEYLLFNLWLCSNRIPFEFQALILCEDPVWILSWIQVNFAAEARWGRLVLWNAGAVYGAVASTGVGFSIFLEDASPSKIWYRQVTQVSFRWISLNGWRRFLGKGQTPINLLTVGRKKRPLWYKIWAQSGHCKPSMHKLPKICYVWQMQCLQPRHVRVNVHTEIGD